MPTIASEEDARPGDAQDLIKRLDAHGRLDADVPMANGKPSASDTPPSARASRPRASSGRAPAIHYVNRAYPRWYWQQVLGPLLTEVKPHFGKSVKYLATDSWEPSGINWTPDFLARFTRRRSYDPLPYLPIIAGRIPGSRETSHRFLDDFRYTMGDLVAERHYAEFSALARRSGPGIHSESGGPRAHASRSRCVLKKCP